MKGTIKIDDATVSEEVIAQMAGSVALECFGIVGMAAASRADGIMSLITGESLAKGVVISVQDDLISVAFHVVVAYGVSIQAVCQNLVENVKYKLESFTGLGVRHVDVYVEGVRPID